MPLRTCLPLASRLIPLLALASSPLSGAEDPRFCNQLGREIALRAGEELGTLDAGERNRLAELAESACLDLGAMPAVSATTAPAATATPADAAAARATDVVEDGRRGFMERIPPEERVRRPALKRP